MESLPDLSSLLLSLAVLLCTYVSYLCYLPPNPSPPNPNSKDRIKIEVSETYTRFHRTTILFLGISHAWLCINSNPSPALCPHHANINKDLFTWNIQTIGCILLILTFGSIRLIAFKQLGESFTFQLSKPKKLVTTGLYRYSRNPSYIGLTIQALAGYWMMLTPDGVAACWLPTRLAGLKVAWMVFHVGKLAVTAVLRMGDEERMMKGAFGKEWEEYCVKTKRFIPFVF